MATKIIKSKDLIVEINPNPVLPKIANFHKIAGFNDKKRDLKILSEHLPLVNGIIIYEDSTGNAVYFNGEGIRAKYVDKDSKIIDEFVEFYNRHCRIYVTIAEREAMIKHFELNLGLKYDMKTSLEKIFDRFIEQDYTKQEAIAQIMELYKLPDVKTVNEKAIEYAKDQWKTCKCIPSELGYTKKDFIAGVEWIKDLQK